MRGWACRCGFKNEPGHRKCRGCSKKKPARRVPVHARTLRDDTYQDVYKPFAAEVHGVTDDSCNICGKPKPERGNHHRDHGHLKGDPSFGRPRGILCWKCNNLLPREVTVDWLESAMNYLRRVDDHYRKGVDGWTPTT